VKEQLSELFRRHFGQAPRTVSDLRADGSDRKLFRLTGEDDLHVVGVYGPDHEENRAFLSFSGSLRSVGIPVPQIHAADEEQGIYLEEDLGDITLFDALSAVRSGAEFPESIVPIYRHVVEWLPRIQIDGGRVIDYSVAYPYEAFDRQSIMWDLNYFKYHFLKPAKIRFNEARLERDFIRFCDFLLGADRTHFLYRDFQSRNIMLRSGEPWFIDYQGGRRGALHYDIASLLYDAKADLPQSLRDELLHHYLDALAAHTAVDRDAFIPLFRGYVLVRIMQAMGAYGYRGIFERKPHFLASIPYAVANIEAILAAGPLPVELSELHSAFQQIVQSEVLRSIEEERERRESENRSAQRAANGATRPVAHHPASGSDASPLTVRIQSFSYKRGYPADESGHGGGFVFDCRALHNPGRYADYKDACGCDTEVIEFLEREEDVPAFWENVRGLVEGAVRTYLVRGFANLSVAFGCTGGQHRSVYFAERLAAYLRQTYPMVQVELSHREEDRWPGKQPVSSATIDEER
jgi:aminoglycoside/choline kinase family phosphotransferase